MEYTYYFQNNESCVLQAGKDGVTEELLRFLQENDRETGLQDRYQREREDYALKHALRAYCADPMSKLNPIEQIADSKADIFKLLCPDETENGTEKKVRQAIEQLTENQQDLVWEAYGMVRGDTEIAKEQNTSRQAIQNRRNKIKSRIEKLLMEL